MILKTEIYELYFETRCTISILTILSNIKVKR